MSVEQATRGSKARYIASGSSSSETSLPPAPPPPSQPARDGGVSGPEEQRGTAGRPLLLSPHPMGGPHAEAPRSGGSHSHRRVKEDVRGCRGGGGKWAPTMKEPQFLGRFSTNSVVGQGVGPPRVLT